MGRISLSRALGSINPLRLHKHRNDADGGGVISPAQLITQGADVDITDSYLRVFDGGGFSILDVDVATDRVKIAQALVLGLLNPTISADQNNWSPTGWPKCGVVFVDCGGASRTITGLATSAMQEGQMIWLAPYNCGAGGAGTLTLPHGSGSSSSGNRFATPGAVSYVLNSNGGVMVLYSTAASAVNTLRVLGKS